MPKEKNQHKSAAASDEKFRDFFTTTVADIPAEMVRREEEAAEEHKGLFGRLFGHAKPKQAPQAGTDLELPTGEVLLGADALAKPDGEEPLDLDLTLRTADPGTDFPQPKAEVPAAPEKPTVPDRPAPQPAPENKTTQTEGTAMKKTIHIEGMMCGHCEATVKKALEALDGVQSAEVSHEKGTAVVSLTHDVADADLKTAVEARDYTVTGIDA